MIHELNEAIRNHQDTAVNGLITIAGTLAGSVFALLLTWFYEKYRGWGRVTFAETRGSFHIEYDPGNNDLQFGFKVRVCNPTPNNRSVTLHGAEFHTRRYIGRGFTPPDPDDYEAPVAVIFDLKLVSSAGTESDDLSLPGAGFSHFEVRGRKRLTDPAHERDARNLAQIGCICVRFNVFPGKREQVWVLVPLEVVEGIVHEHAQRYGLAEQNIPRTRLK